MHLVGLGGNYTYETILHVNVYKSNMRLFGERGPNDILKALEIKPTFRFPNQAAWLISGRTKQAYSTEELAALLFETLLNEIQSRSRSSA